MAYIAIHMWKKENNCFLSIYKNDWWQQQQQCNLIENKDQKVKKKSFSIDCVSF